jgi:hypothetical protein
MIAAEFAHRVPFLNTSALRFGDQELEKRQPQGLDS